MPDLEIWLSCKGRQMIEHTKNLVKEKFTTLGGYEHNAEVCHLTFLLIMGVQSFKTGLTSVVELFYVLWCCKHFLCLTIEGIFVLAI